MAKTPASAATDLLKKLGDQLKGKEEEDVQPPVTPQLLDEPPVATDMSLDPGGLKSLADQVRQAYQTTILWILSVFGAFGLLIFGSLPFANIGRASGEWKLWLGLSLAALGLASVVLAASTVFEPAVTSLGELEGKLRARWPNPLPPAKAKAARPPRWTTIGSKPVRKVARALWRWFRKIGRGISRAWRSFRWLLAPRRAVLRDLRDMLEGEESEAHLGPGMHNLKDLIHELGQLDNSQLQAAKKVAGGQARIAALGTAVEAHVGTLEALQQRLESVNQLPNSSSKRWLLKGVQRAFADEAVGRAAASGARAKAATASADDQAGLAEQDICTKEYLGHRQLVLLEASVLQMRGTFRLARRRAFFGALLLLIGASLYASVLPAEESKDKKPGTTQPSPTAT